MENKMENTTDMSSSKEEEDKAWWSDYQASTKLKRKWVKEEKSAFDDFDDILGDLDDIVSKGDAVKDKEKLSTQTDTKTHCVQSTREDDWEIVNYTNSEISRDNTNEVLQESHEMKQNVVASKISKGKTKSQSEKKLNKIEEVDEGITCSTDTKKFSAEQATTEPKVAEEVAAADRAIEENAAAQKASEEAAAAQRAAGQKAQSRRLGEMT